MDMNKYLNLRENNYHLQYWVVCVCVYKVHLSCVKSRLSCVSKVMPFAQDRDETWEQAQNSQNMGFCNLQVEVALLTFSGLNTSKFSIFCCQNKNF